MANISVSYDDVRDAAEYFSARYDEVVTILANVEQRAAQLVRGGFTTDVASGRFEEVTQRLSGQLRGSTGCFLELRAYLLSVADALQDFDTRAAARIG